MSDEAASVAEAPVTAIALPADAPESFDTPEAATRYFLSQKKQTAESADPATAEAELSDEDNAAADENQPTGEDEEAAPAEKPSRELPRSWTKDQNERWAKLDPDMQDFLLEQDRKGSEVVRRSQNEAAEKLKGLTAKEQQLEQARQQAETQAKAAQQVLLREQTRDFPDIKTIDDVRNLAATDPFRYLAWDAHQKELAAAQMAVQQAESRQATEKQTERKARSDREHALLIEKAPEYADAKKLDAAQKAAAKLFGDVGYSTSELAELGNEPIIGDHRFQLIVDKALKYDALQSAKSAVAAKPVPPVQRPGSSQPSGGNVERIQTLNQSLTNSGRMEDATALLIARRAANQRRAS